MKQLFSYIGFIVVFVLVGSRVLRMIPGRLGQDYVVLSSYERVGPLQGLTDTQFIKLLSSVWEMGVPLIVALMICLVARGLTRPRGISN
jgi:hypothetical protein